MMVAVLNACVGSLISSIYLAAQLLLSTDMDPAGLLGWFRHCHRCIFSNSILTKNSIQHALIALCLKWMWMERLVVATRPNLCKIPARKCVSWTWVEEELHLLNGVGHQMRLLWTNSGLWTTLGNIFSWYLNILYETGCIFFSFSLPM